MGPALWLVAAISAMQWPVVTPASADLSVSAIEVNPRLDVRAFGGSGRPETLRLMQAEVNLRISLAYDDEELVTLALGPNLETGMMGRGRQMHFSNYYAVWNFGVGKPKLRTGQFVVPFGTLAEYDTHPLVLQTPYARTLGIRLDRGAEVDGFLGDWEYRASLTTGDGRSRHDGSYAAIARVAKDFESGGEFYRLGFSALHGESMPRFPIMPMPLPHDDAPITRVDKDRFAIDLDWLHGTDNIRAELVAGRDDGDFAHGQWLLWNRPLSYDTDITLQGDRWQDPGGVVYGLGASVHHRLDDFSGVAAAYGPRWARPADGRPNQFEGLVTLQYYRNFNLSF